MARVLYISYTGLMDPLGQSQVLQYVLGLAERHKMTLLTFERPTNLSDVERLMALEARCRAAGVEWYARTWHNRPSLLATVYDILAGNYTATRLALKSRAEIVHCRSYIGSLIGLVVKRRTGARLIFDMRGFWADERVDGGACGAAAGELVEAAFACRRRPGRRRVRRRPTANRPWSRVDRVAWRVSRVIEHRSPARQRRGRRDEDGR